MSEVVILGLEQSRGGVGGFGWVHSKSKLIARGRYMG